MSLIEQAAQRLEQLRQAGVQAPEPLPGPPTATAGPNVTVAAATDLPAEPLSRSVEVDLQRLAAAGMVTPGAPRAHIADQFRVIKRPLLANAVGKGAAPVAQGNLIMVTSALSGEGKSFTALNLAMSIATELDHTVMLVDADVARPSLPATLGVERGPGLLDVLEGQAAMHEVLLRTSVEKLTLLRSGTPHPRATELLASDAMRSLLAEMARRYKDRILIFDSPPLLLTTEARVLATHMGQIVMVVAAERTPQSAVQHALSTIESCPVKLMLLNQARVASQGAYGYGYGYGYGYAGNGHGAEAA